MHLFIQKAVSFIFLFSGIFTSHLNAEPGKYIPHEYLDYVDEISMDFAREVEKEFGLTAIGFGGCMPEKVEEIGIKFYCDKEMNINNARWLMITLRQKLVEKVNRHEKIRPFLAEYPFSIQGANIQLTFLENSDKNARNVEFVFFGKKGIYYCKFNQEKRKYDDLLIESYEDALQAYKPTDKPMIFKKVI